MFSSLTDTLTHYSFLYCTFKIWLQKGQHQLSVVAGLEITIELKSLYECLVLNAVSESLELNEEAVQEFINDFTGLLSFADCSG